MKNKNSRKVKMNFDPITVAIWISITGLFLVLITAFDWKTKNGFLTILENILNCLGTTLISVGLVSILVELSTIRAVVDEAMKNVLSENIPLESYSNSFLNTLKTRITAHVSDLTINQIQKSVYKLEPNLLNLTNSLFYDYSTMNCVVIPDDKNKLFTKRITIKYKIINNYELDNCVKLVLSLYDIKANMTDDERLNNVKITQFRINNENLINDPLIKKTIIPINSEDRYEYDYMYVFERPLQKCTSHEVLLEYEYITSQLDCTQSWKLKYPCKKTEHTISIKNSNKWILKANGFASFYHNNSELRDFYKVEQSVEESAKIKFDEWAIPGAGYVISYKSK